MRGLRRLGCLLGLMIVVAMLACAPASRAGDLDFTPGTVCSLAVYEDVAHDTADTLEAQLTSESAHSDLAHEIAGIQLQAGNSNKDELSAGALRRLFRARLLRRGLGKLLGAGGSC